MWYQRNPKATFDERHYGCHEIGFIDNTGREPGPATTANHFIKETGRALAMKLHKGLCGQTLQADNLLPGETMSCWQGDDQVVGVNHFLVKFGTVLWRQWARESQVNLTLVEGRKLLVRV